MWGPCPVCLSVLLLIKVSWCHCLSEPLTRFPHIPTLWQVQSQSGSQTVLAHLFSQLQLSPGSPALWHCPGQHPPLQLGCAASRVCGCCLSHPPSDFTRSSFSWQGSGISLPWEGMDPLGCCNWPGSPPLSWGSSCATEDLTSLPVKLPYRPFCSVLCTLWLPNLAKILLAFSVCSLEDQLRVPVGCRSKWSEFSPTPLPSSPCFIINYI